MEGSPKKILFFYLSAFSATGGIEKFNRSFIKALHNLTTEGIELSVASVYDTQCDENYIQRKYFRGFSKNRIRSLCYVLGIARKYDLVILGHINLSIAGILIKILNPKGKIALVAHGIEAWGKLRLEKNLCLKVADIIFAVSNYTKNQLVLNNKISPSKIALFPNTVDPFFNYPGHPEKPGYLLQRYQLQAHHPVIFTLSRLGAKDEKKGYDMVISALPLILKSFPEAVYVLAGKCSLEEKERLNKLARFHGVENNLLITGFIDDSEIPDHYQLADVFIMPSRKEGFGIVFLEAMLCGTPVIGGNQDGTVEALLNGYLGQLINPTQKAEIVASISRQLSGEIFSNPLELQEKVISHFGFKNYQQKLKATLQALLN